MKIDESAWKQDILKAAFDFDFGNKDDEGRRLAWKGNIYVSIEK